MNWQFHPAWRDQTPDGEHAGGRMEKAVTEIFLIVYDDRDYDTGGQGNIAAFTSLERAQEVRDRLTAALYSGGRRRGNGRGERKAYNEIRAILENDGKF